jgi:hypothetical protein
VITDGPFGESKEVIGGYWFILADNLDEAAQIAKGNPVCIAARSSKIRPVNPQRATPDNAPRPKISPAKSAREIFAL